MSTIDDWRVRRASTNADAAKEVMQPDLGEGSAGSSVPSTIQQQRSYQRYSRDQAAQKEEAKKIQEKFQNLSFIKRDA